MAHLLVLALALLILRVNAKAARAIGIEIPRIELALADEVIE